MVYGDGTGERDFTRVEDIARGTIAALRPMGYEGINLDSDHPVVLMDAMGLVEDMLGKKAQVKHRRPYPADVKATWAAIAKEEGFLGCQPQIRFEEGVETAAKSYLGNREWAREIRLE